MHKALACINHVSASHRYEHDGQRKRVAHMPTATTTEAASRFTIGLKAPTRLRGEAKYIRFHFSTFAKGQTDCRCASESKQELRLANFQTFRQRGQVLRQVLSDRLGRK